MRRKLREKFDDLRYETLGRPRVPTGPEDRWLVSYPRSGNTWMRYLIVYAMNPDREMDINEVDARMPIVYHPQLATYLEQLDAAGQRRMLKSHDPCRAYMLEARVVYLVRNAYDALASFYHFCRNASNTDLSLSGFVASVCTGRFRYGSWQAHVESWLAHEQNDQLLIVRYEQMLSDTAGVLRRVLDHYQVDATDAAIKQAVERANVGHVSAGLSQWAQQRGKQFTGGLGGGAGRGKQALSPEDVATISKHAGPTLRRLGYDVL